MEKARTNVISWDQCFMNIAWMISERSKDPSTQAGAVIITPDNRVIGMGYNGFPRGIEKMTWERTGTLSKTKYAYVCHAEENAVYNSTIPVVGSKIYCTLYPCNECAKTLIQTGVKEIIYDSDKYHDDQIWVAARKLFTAAKIKTRQFSA